MKKTKRQQIIDLLEKEPEAVVRATYISDKVGISHKSARVTLHYLANQNKIESIYVGRREVWYGSKQD